MAPQVDRTVVLSLRRETSRLFNGPR
ncbi:hypothetical protein BN381_10254 [Candidatus Microthrix parvicella RN1]|uniref:Uncharacterized protein n=1 Tax=Candidatus Neomicrothrix parvicella RN1 TaxID=1229780 RepID=R4YVZ7_9ACTN|nr:hypothetical protein BN381_10254 [Candidatus Microthrix parvicella RN1]